MNALCRDVSSSFARALVRHAPAEPIDLERARAEHAGYVAALRALGVEVRVLPPLDDQPDACFVEDTVVVVDGVALLTRPGHPSRRPEVDSVGAALPLPAIRMVRGTLDGGDVLRVGRRLYVGRSARTDAEGQAELAAAFPAWEVVPVPLRDGLHLKSGATALPDGRLLVAAERVDPAAFAEGIVTVPDGEDDACNVVVVGQSVLVAAGFPATADRLRAEGFAVRAVENRELRKADSALTCLSVLW